MEIKIVGKRILEEDLNGLLVKGEAGIETVELLLEKNYRGLDLSRLNFTLFMRSAKGGVLTSTVLAKTVDGDNLRLAWKIGRDFTSTAGAAQIEISGMDGSGTAIFKAVSKQFSVLDNIESGSNLPPKDVIEQALEDMQVNLSEAAERVADAASWANRAKGYSDQAKQSAATVDTKVQAAQDVTNALTAATGTANSSNTTLQTAINQAKAALKNLQDAIGEAELENYLSATGTAVAAKKLETSREIGLTGAVTGSAEFDGSGNISIKTLPLYSLVGKSSGTTTPRWYKFASLKTSIPSNWDATIIFLVDAVFNAGNKIQGLLRAHVRKNNTDIDPGNMDISWIYAGTDINVEDYVMAYKLPNTVELWCKISALYRVVHFQVLATYDRHEILSNWWNLYETINDTNPTELPEGYTQVPSTYSNLKTGGILAQGDLDIAAPSTGAYHLRMSALGTNPDNGNNGIERVDISALAKNNSSRPVPALWFANTYAGNVRSVILSNIHNPVSNTDAANKEYVDTKFAALQAQLSALNLDAATLSVPNEAPTLEAPGEEEITV